MLTLFGSAVVGDGVPPEALRSGDEVQRNVVKRAGRPKSAPRVTLKTQLLARMTPRGQAQRDRARGD
jgi:hypothetical protein